MERFFAHLPAEFPKGKEWKKSAEHHNGTARELIEAQLAGSLGKLGPMDRPFDPFLNNVESKHKQAKHKRLPHGRHADTNTPLFSCILPNYSPIMMTFVITSAFSTAKPKFQYATSYCFSRNRS